MTTTVLAPPVAAQPLQKNSKQNLPTFPLDVGWRMQFNEQTQQWDRLPLRLMDILFPYDSDKAVIEMVQSPLHFEWSTLLVEKIRPELAPQGWLILGDVLCYWEYPGVPPQSPDLAFYYGVEPLGEEQRSYHVGVDGPRPDFVIELTSQSTRNVDLETKPNYYAAMGVYELLIIDTQTPDDEDWRLLGYRLGGLPTYHLIEPDAEGGVTIESVGLRFVAVRREQIEVYEAVSGRRLLTAEEQRARADEEAIARAAAEAQTEQERQRTTAAEAQVEQERQRTAAAEAEAEQERIARSDVEAELAKMKARLRSLGIED